MGERLSDARSVVDIELLNSLTISGIEAGTSSLKLKADEGDDAGDNWNLSVADGGVLTINNDIYNKTEQAMLTVTPNTDAAGSTTSIAGKLAVTGATTLTGNLVAPKMSPFYTAVAKIDNFSAEAGKCYLVTKLDGCAITLPPPTVGAKIKLVLGGLTSSNHVITTDDPTILYNGYALLSDTADGTAAEHAVFAPNGTSDNVIQLNATTTGISGTIELTGTSATAWFCEAVICASGTIATPFA